MYSQVIFWKTWLKRYFLFTLLGKKLIESKNMKNKKTSVLMISFDKKNQYNNNLSRNVGVKVLAMQRFNFPYI